MYERTEIISKKNKPNQIDVRHFLDYFEEYADCNPEYLADIIDEAIKMLALAKHERQFIDNVHNTIFALYGLRDAFRKIEIIEET